jgi:ABC-type branched-subunit amino acid transport system ATPase component
MELFPEIGSRQANWPEAFLEEQQMVAIGRLSCKPSLLLVDELSLVWHPWLWIGLRPYCSGSMRRQAWPSSLWNRTSTLSMAKIGYVLEAGHIRAHSEASAF